MIEDIYPLSPMQSGLLFHKVYSPDDDLYFRQTRIRGQGMLEELPFLRAWETAIRRHQILRSYFVWETREPVQVVCKNISLPYVTENWRGLEQDALESRMQEFLRDDRQRGFDLSQAPLLRIALIYMPNERYEVVISHHHLILDGWSQRVLINEVLTLYHAYRSGEQPSLEPACPYRDYIAWLKRQDKKLSQAFWTKALQNLTDVTPLPLTGLGPGQNTHGFEYESVSLSESSTIRLNELCRQHQVTLNTVLQGMWALLLSRHSGENDIVFGAVIAGRPPELANVEQAVGVFINTLPVRVQVRDDLPVWIWLQQLQNQQIEAREFDYSSLAEIQTWSGVVPPATLFQSCIIFENYAGFEDGKQSHVKTREMLWELIPTIESTNYPLAITCGSAQKLTIRLTYSTSFYERCTAQQLLRQLACGLETLVSHDIKNLGEVEILPRSEKEQLLAWGRGADAQFGSGMVHTLFTAQALKTPEAVAVSFEDQNLTYVELDRRSNRLARYLAHRGVAPEVPVGIFLDRSPEMLVALLGILKAGGAYVPLDPDYPVERLKFMVDDAQLKIVVSQSYLAGRAETATTAICFDLDGAAIERESVEAYECGVISTNTAYVIYTSGSTGTPKGVQISHAALSNVLQSMRQAPAIHASDVLGAVTTLAFDIAALELYLPLIVGARVRLLSRATIMDVQSFLREVTQGITMMQATPATWQMLLAQGWKNGSNLRVLCGGEELPIGLATDLSNTGAFVWNMYGPTETTIWSVMEAIEDASEGVCIGRPIANTGVFVLNGGFMLQPAMATGQLFIGGAGLARGYRNRPDLTAEQFIPHPFAKHPGERLYRTGDLARWNKDGRLEFLGRRDHQVKVRGYRIELGEIEAVLRQHSGVREAVVIMAQEKSQKQLVAYMTMDQEQVSGVDWRAYLKKQLPEYMVPAQFITVPAMPRTLNGKVDRKALLKIERPIKERDESVSDTAIAEIIAGIWTELLAVKEVARNDNFFELGGHSLLATQLVSRLRQSLGVELPLRSIFDFPVLTELVREVERISWQNIRVAVPALVKQASREEFPLSFAQHRLWFLDQLLPDRAMYNIARMVRLKGELDISVVRRSIDTLVQRHEVLRTVFEENNGEIIQRVMAGVCTSLPIVDLKEAPHKAQLAAHLAREESSHPFDISKGPPLRALLAVLGDDDYVLLLTMHHIVSDGWSLEIAAHELKILYSAYRENQEPSLPELTIQYGDYAAWQRTWLTEEVLDGQVKYWTQQLAGLPLLALPTDYRRPSVQDTRGGILFRVIDKDLKAKLLQVSRREGTTVFMVLLAAFQLILSRWCGQADIAVGTPITNRTRMELEPLIGFFVNTLVLRTRLLPTMTFQEFLRHVKNVCLEAYAHQDLPFERLVEILQPQRSLSYNPLFQVFFNFTKALDGSSISADSQMSPDDFPTLESRFDLTLDVHDLNTFYALSVTYQQALFTKSRMALLLEQLVFLLHEITDNPELPLAAYSLAREQNATRTGDKIEHPETILNKLETWILTTPDKVAIEQGDDHCSYAGLGGYAGWISEFLLQKGFQSSDVVAILGRKEASIVAAAIAVMRMGGTVLILDNEAETETQRQAIRDGGAHLLLEVTYPEEGEKWAAMDMEILPLPHPPRKELNGSVGRISALPFPEANRPAISIFVSDSSGGGRRRSYAHGAVAEFIQWESNTFRLSCDDRVGQVVPLGNNSALWDMLLALATGSTLCLPCQNSIENEKGNITWLLDNRITIAHLLSQSAGEEDSRSETGNADNALRHLLFVGEAPTCGVIKAIHQRSPQTTISYLYCPKNAGLPTNSYMAPSRSDVSLDKIGSPLPQVRVFITDSLDRSCPIGEVGEVQMQIPEWSVLNLTPTPAQPLSQGLPLSIKSGSVERIGEKGYMLPDGSIQLVHICDQAGPLMDETAARQLEQALAASGSVAMAAVQIWEEGEVKKSAAYVVGLGCESDVKRHSLSLLRESSIYNLDPEVIIVSALPLLPNGMIARTKLMRPNQAGLPDPEEHNILETPVGRELARIWQETLRVDRVRADDNFFSLGGHSILATKLLSRIKKTFNVNLRLRMLFANPTLGAFAAALESCILESLDDAMLKDLLDSTGETKPKGPLSRSAIGEAD